jgi:hypothetical protein
MEGFRKLETFHQWTIGLYVLLTIGIFYLFEPNPQMVFWYGLLTQFSLYAFGYKALRNLTVYLIWLAIGLFHFYLYVNLSALGFEMEWENGVTPLRNTAALLLIFQLLRFVNLKINGQEPVLPGRIGGYDLFDEREVNWVDVVLFLIYIGCMVGFNFL